YETARHLARTMARLGEKHWNNLPWDGDLGRDDRLKDLLSEEILNDSKTVLDDLDDLCVLLLFSVLEATIRARVLAEVEAELPPPARCQVLTPTHPGSAPLCHRLSGAASCSVRAAEGQSIRAHRQTAVVEAV